MSISSSASWRTCRVIVCAVPSVLAGHAVFTAVGATSGGTDWVQQIRNGPGVSNHPVQVVPSADIQVPDGWPLGPGGTITCLTCHEALPRPDDRGEYRLRASGEWDGGPGGFCSNCHRRADARTSSGAHWMALRRAHIKPGSNSSAAAARELILQSNQCMGCHDGVSAVEFSNSTPWRRGPGAMGDAARNHPVGVDYPLSSRFGAGGRYRPAAALPPTVLLPGGKVGCVSCHDLYASERSYLTVPLEGSELCMTCHEMD